MAKKTKRRNYHPKGGTKWVESRGKRKVKRVKKRTQRNRTKRVNRTRRNRTRRNITKKRNQLVRESLRGGWPGWLRRGRDEETVPEPEEPVPESEEPVPESEEPVPESEEPAPEPEEPAPEPEGLIEEEVDMDTKRQFVSWDDWTENVEMKNSLSSLSASEDVGIISGHGVQIDNQFTIIPEGITFNLYSSSGEATSAKLQRTAHCASCDARRTAEISALQASISESEAEAQTANDNIDAQIRERTENIERFRREIAETEQRVAVLRQRPEEPTTELLAVLSLERMFRESIVWEKKQMEEDERERERERDYMRWKIGILRDDVSLLETDDYFFREYQSGSLIQNYIVDFDLKLGLESESGSGQGWAPGGIFTENVNTFLTQRVETQPTGYSIENVLAKHHAAGWMTPTDVSIIKAKNHAKSSTAFPLSDLFQIISKKAVKPSVWIGSFCRSGTPFGIDNLLNCNLAGYDPLSPYFFSGKMVRADGALTSQTSLSANVRTQNFKGMLEKIMRTKGLEGALLTGDLAGVPASAKLLGRDSKTKEETLRLVRVWSTTLVGEPLDYEDVCFILLLYNKIK
jgi:hypothetical protein